MGDRKIEYWECEEGAGMLSHTCPDDALGGFFYPLAL